MLPLIDRDTRAPKGRLGSLRERLQSWMRLIYADQTSRNLFMFLLLNLSFAFVELFYGVYTNSLGLISDAFHMFFDCTGLVAGLVATVISKWKPNDRYSYGYARAEILAGFVNGLFLLFIAFFIMSEAVERAIEPPEVKHERLLVVSVLGLLVNLVGIYAFSHAHSHAHGGHQHAHNGHDHGHSHGGGGSAIMRGVFLHVLADTLGSVGVIVSALLMRAFGWMRADPICSMAIALLIAGSVLGLVKDAGAVLMQRTPEALEAAWAATLRRAAGLAGVAGVGSAHCWALSSSERVAALTLEVREGTDARYVTQAAQRLLREAGFRHVTVQLDFPP